MNRAGYTKPDIKKIKLSIEEAVLTGCKKSGSVSKGGDCRTLNGSQCCQIATGS